MSERLPLAELVHVEIMTIQYSTSGARNYFRAMCSLFFLDLSCFVLLCKTHLYLFSRGKKIKASEVDTGILRLSVIATIIHFVRAYRYDIMCHNSDDGTVGRRGCRND